MEQLIHAISREELSRLESQRTWVRGHYKPKDHNKYETVEGKVTLLAAIMRNRWIKPKETVKLQSLGVAFGDALVQELGLKWVAIEDEYGRDPALILEGTSIKVFPLTTISKRIEHVDVVELFAKTCGTIMEIKAGGA